MSVSSESIWEPLPPPEHTWCPPPKSSVSFTPTSIPLHISGGGGGWIIPPAIVSASEDKEDYLVKDHPYKNGWKISVSYECSLPELIHKYTCSMSKDNVLLSVSETRNNLCTNKTLIPLIENLLHTLDKYVDLDN